MGGKDLTTQQRVVAYDVPVMKLVTDSIQAMIAGFGHSHAFAAAMVVPAMCSFITAQGLETIVKSGNRAVELKEFALMYSTFDNVTKSFTVGAFVTRFSSNSGPQGVGSSSKSRKRICSSG